MGSTRLTNELYSLDVEIENLNNLHKTILLILSAKINLFLINKCSKVDNNFVLSLDS